MIHRKRNKTEQRRSTLKLWQQHIQTLSKPDAKPLLKRFEEEGFIYENDSVTLRNDETDEADPLSISH